MSGFLWRQFRRALAAMLLAVLASCAGLPVGRGVAARQEQAPEIVTRQGELACGISVKGVNYDDDSLDRAITLGLEWIKIYDHPPPERLPFKVLYRVNLPRPGEDWSEWGHYRFLDAQLYAGRIDAYEIGNEPNLIEEWGSPPDPAAYVELLKIAHREIKSADPDALIVSAGLAPVGRGAGPNYLNDLDYLQAMYEHGVSDYVDVISLHPFGFGLPPEMPVDGQICTTVAPGEGPVLERGCWSIEGFCFRRAELAHEIMAAYGDGDKPVWATEFGWLVRPPICCQSSREWGLVSAQAVTEGQQARYLLRAIDYAEQNWPWMEVMFLWNLDYSRYPPDPAVQCPYCDSMGWYSILRPNGSPRQAYRWLCEQP